MKHCMNVFCALGCDRKIFVVVKMDLNGKMTLIDGSF